MGATILKVKEGDRAMVSGISGDFAFRSYLLSNGITKGTIITVNYSPSFSKLINISVGGKMLGLKSEDFRHIDIEILEG